MTKTLIPFPTMRNQTMIKVFFSNAGSMIFTGYNESVCLNEALAVADERSWQIDFYIIC